MAAAKFVVSDAVAALWESVLRHDGFTAFTQRVPEQLIRWEAECGWTRQGYGQVPDKETALGVLLARLLTTPDMWQAFAEAHIEALDAIGRAAPPKSRFLYASFDFDEGKYQRQERAKNLSVWHELLLDHFGAGPDDELLDRLTTSPGLAGPELTFLRAHRGTARSTRPGRRAHDRVPQRAARPPGLPEFRRRDRRATPASRARAALTPTIRIGCRQRSVGLGPRTQ
jgi:hypothetical protein